MTKEVVTPSNTALITAGQIGKICDLLSSRLRKSRFPSEFTQQVIEHQGDALADELVGAIRKRIEAASDMIVRHVRVNRARTPQEALDATSCVQYTNRKVVDRMPKGEGEEVEVSFVKLDRYVSDDDLADEYELRSLKPADPYLQFAVNEADSTFADKHPNGTHWKDADHNWCFSAFNRWSGVRDVSVGRNVSDWHGGWWFAGVRK